MFKKGIELERIRMKDIMHRVLKYIDHTKIYIELNLAWYIIKHKKNSS